MSTTYNSLSVHAVVAVYFDRARLDGVGYVVHLYAIDTNGSIMEIDIHTHDNSLGPVECRGSEFSPASTSASRKSEEIRRNR